MTRVSTRRLLLSAALIVIASLIVAGCSESDGGTQQQPSDTNVEPLPGDRAEMSIALPDGTLPCGLGQVEWGTQVFKLEDYPSCQSAAPVVSVYCLDDQAQWTAEAITITDITMGAITIDAQREGICGIFPKQ